MTKYYIWVGYGICAASNIVDSSNNMVLFTSRVCGDYYRPISQCHGPILATSKSEAQLTYRVYRRLTHA